jgi:cobalt/nickel transport system permease protein
MSASFRAIRFVQRKIPPFYRIYYGALAAWLVTTAMHIPDGYLSPATSLVMFALVLPFWAVGVRKIRQTMSARSVPLIALMAAFSFVIMMFNVPLPGGTTGHAVGAALAAILLGPETATIAITIALVIQAFFFGDGGLLAIGANSFNMAVVIPYVSYAIYQAFARNTPANSARRPVGAALGGWVGVTAGAFFAGFEFGLQPLLFKAADGAPLYAPYPLAVAIPAMVVPHMLVASVVEGVLTALVVAYLQRANSVLLQPRQVPAQADGTGAALRLRWLWAGLILLALVSPLGLLAPGTAWGEWSTAELTRFGLKSIPGGMQQLSGLWGAPLARYNLPVLGNANLGYLLSAAVGLLVTTLVVWLFTLLLTSHPGTGIRTEFPAPAVNEAQPELTRGWRQKNEAGESRFRGGSDVLERSLRTISGSLEQSLFAEQLSARPGLFQSLDGRVKVLAVLALLLGVGFTHSLVVLAALYLLVLVLALLSALPLGFFLRRVWLALPFFSGVIILPALFITPGPALAYLPLGLVLTRTGLTTALFLLLRVSNSVSLALLLILTTPWNTVLSALGVLRIPDAFILILGMTYRYIFLLLHTANDMFLSRKSRAIGRLNGAESRRTLAAIGATLLNKSLYLSGEVYLAMQSRGFRGTIVTLKPFAMRTRDWLWLILFLSVTLLAIWLGR